MRLTKTKDEDEEADGYCALQADQDNQTEAEDGLLRLEEGKKLYVDGMGGGDGNLKIKNELGEDGKLGG